MSAWAFIQAASIVVSLRSRRENHSCHRMSYNTRTNVAKHFLGLSRPERATSALPAGHARHERFRSGSVFAAAPLSLPREVPRSALQQSSILSCIHIASLTCFQLTKTPEPNLFRLFFEILKSTPIDCDLAVIPVLPFIYRPHPVGSPWD